MKITKSRLKEIIKEEILALEEGDLYGGDSPHETLADVKNDPNYHQAFDDNEGQMAQGQLKRIAELANMISEQFDDSSNLEEWVESKITKALDYLSSVMNYMRGKEVERPEEADKLAYAWDFVKRAYPESPEIEDQLKNPFRK